MGRNCFGYFQFRGGFFLLQGGFGKRNCFSRGLIVADGNENERSSVFLRVGRLV